MKVVEQSYQVIKNESPLKHIERIARVCYKSEDRITDDSSSAVKIIKNLHKNGHMAMLEHYRFILKVGRATYRLLEKIETPYIKMTAHKDRYIISFSIRGLMEMVEHSHAIDHDVLPQAVEVLRDNIIVFLANRYGYELFGMDDLSAENTIGFELIPNIRSVMSPIEWTAHGWMSVLFTTNRGITHELVRHRPCSFAQESTRYCNYGDGDGTDIIFIDPKIKDNIVCEEWVIAMKFAEDRYMQMIEHGSAPQIARGVLPTDVKADIVLTANVEEWLHIFELRALQLTGKAHPQMVSLMGMLFTVCINKWYICGGYDGSHLRIGGEWQYE